MSKFQTNPSLIWLVGQKDWEELKRLVGLGAYDGEARDVNKMATVIAFAVNYKAPPDVIRLLTSLNPDSLLDKRIGDIPFRLARSLGTPAKTVIYLEAARQNATVRQFGGQH